MERGMKWYNFLIWIALPFSVLANLFGAYRMITGMHYGDAASAKMVYELYHGLKMCDMIFAVLAFGIVVFIVITRQNLAHFKVSGPKYLLFVYIINLMYGVLYPLAVSIITKISLTSLIGTGNQLATIVTSVIMIFVNRSYFDNRKDLFVN